MANTLMSLLIKLGVDTKDVNKGLDDAEKKSKKSSDSIANSMMSIGFSLQNTGQIMTESLTKPIISGFKSMISGASDLAESQNAVNVLFEDASSVINEFGKNSATAVGLSTAAFNQASTVTGAFLKNLGYDTKAAADETISLTERASDMASFFNTDVSQALGAIQSGLKGEFNPLERFGVKLNAAAIEAKALSMGLAETSVDQTKLETATINYNKAHLKLEEAMKKHGAESLEVQEAQNKLVIAEEKLNKVMEGQTEKLDDNMKAQAALALIYEQTEQFAGDFANTSDGLANSTKSLQADIKNITDELGTQFLPYVLQGVTFIKDLATQFKNLSPETQKTIAVVALLAAALGPALMIIGSVISTIGAIIPVVTTIAGVISFPLIAIILAVIAVIALLVVAWNNNWGGIQGKTQEIVNWFKIAIPEFLNNIANWWNEHGGALKTIVDGIWHQIILTFNTFKNIMGDIFRAFSAAFRGDWHSFGAILRRITGELWGYICNSFENAWNTIRDTFIALRDSIYSFFTETDWGKVGKDIIDGIANGIKNAAGFLGDAAKAAAKAAYDAACGFLYIGSPSKLFAEVGKNMMLGWAGGINAYTPAAVGATADVSAATVSVAAPAPSSSTSSQESLKSLLERLLYTLDRQPDDIARAVRSSSAKARR